MRHALLTIPIVLAVGTAAVAVQPTQRTLTFEDRVKAQETIERAYYSHQIGATKPFELAVPRSLLEAKVHTYLDETAALTAFWNTTVTNDMLQRELERIATGTRMPDRLAELYATLGNDPFIIKECFARAILVDRLARGAYAFDPASNGQAHSLAWDDWWKSSRIALNGKAIPVVASERENLPRPGIRLTPQDASSCSIADSWTSTSLLNAPVEIGYNSAVWTGTTVIVWGGASGAFFANTGGRYDPVTDTWTKTSTIGAPAVRGYHSAVWTGYEMIVWGGGNQTGVLNNGGRYDPIGDAWTSMSATGAPTARESHTAVWTGREMVVWGGGGGVSVNTGGRYDPVGDTWRPTSTLGAPSSGTGNVAVWTGSLMVVWGGQATLGGYSPTGGRYDPVNDTWTSISTTAAPQATMYGTAVWTGSMMVVWGGYIQYFYNDYVTTNTGGRYDPLSDSWTATSTTNAPRARAVHTAVWTGKLMVVWGGASSSQLTGGGRYNPLADTWAPTAVDGSPSIRYGGSAVWTGSAMIVWGGGYNGSQDNSGGRYVLVPSPSPDDDADGYTICDGDCDDTSARTFPGAAFRNSVTSCMKDADSDGYGDVNPPAGVAPGTDCDDASATVHPGANELCNGIDDNCNGLIDDDALPPAGRPALAASKAGTATGLAWSTVADATGYDVVKGSLTALRLYENFISGTSGCVGNDLPATTAQDAEVPSPNDGVWYLVRAVNSCAPGGFDDGSPAQVGGRDDSIAASGVACP